MKRIPIIFFITIIWSSHDRQVWSLHDCIDYALKNNTRITNSVLTNREEEISLDMRRNDRLPTLNASVSDNIYFGRGPSRDGTYTDNSQMSANFGISTGINLFSGLRTKNNIAVQKLSLMASVEDTERLKDDITINVISFYLQALFSKELLLMAEHQLEISEALVERTKLMYSVERSTGADLAESQSVYSRDKLNVVECRNNSRMAILELTQAINLQDSEGFDIGVPSSAEADIEIPIPDLNSVYSYAVENNPLISAASYRISMAEKSISIARSALYPSINLTAGYGNSYFYSFVSGYDNKSFSEQLRNNANQYIGVAMSIPIFNKFNNTGQVKLAKIARDKMAIAAAEARNSLCNEIERAYVSAVSSREKYYTAKENTRVMTEVFANEQIKYDVGKTTIFNFNELKQQLLVSESQMLQAKYEFIFKTNILRFYMDVPIDLTML